MVEIEHLLVPQRFDRADGGGAAGKSSSTSGGAAIPSVQTFSAPINFEQSYTNVLPSLNLKMKAAPDLQFRAALSRGIARPDFDKMQAYTTMSVGTQQHTEGNTVVIDSVNGYQASMPEENALILHMHELLQYLNRQGTNTFLTVAQHGLAF